jgi:hypothetical protein
MALTTSHRSANVVATMSLNYYRADELERFCRYQVGIKLIVRRQRQSHLEPRAGGQVVR